MCIGMQPPNPVLYSFIPLCVWSKYSFMPAGASAHVVYWFLMQRWHHCSCFSRWNGRGSLVITKCPCSRLKGPCEQLLILSKASKLVEEKVEPYGVVNKAVGGLAVSGQLLILKPLFRPPAWVVLLAVWQWHDSTQLSCVACPLEEWLAAMERFLVRLLLHVVLQHQALSNFVRVSSLSLPFVLLAFDLTWNELSSRRRMCAPDHQLPRKWLWHISTHIRFLFHVHTHT